jgi:hypothetical protein
MTTWTPISEGSLWDKLNAAESRMSPVLSRLWEVIRVPPQKWAQEPYGNEGGGFWVVAIVGTCVVWYNDIEDGFNYSEYSVFGTIDEYWCNQDDLEHTVEILLTRVRTGELVGGKAGPPEPVTFHST